MSITQFKIANPDDAHDRMLKALDAVRVAVETGKVETLSISISGPDTGAGEHFSFGTPDEVVAMLSSSIGRMLTAIAQGVDVAAPQNQLALGNYLLSVIAEVGRAASFMYLSSGKQEVYGLIDDALAEAVVKMVVAARDKVRDDIRAGVLPADAPDVKMYLADVDNLISVMQQPRDTRSGPVSPEKMN